MAEFYRLINKARHYDWGSPVDIPRLLGITPDGAPWAELWMGGTSGFSSTLEAAAGTTLEELIAGDPRRFLGENIARRYGALPFLLKLLAAEKPLSIQAHPNPEQAREGFERENRAGLPLDSPKRNYKDANHKPEIICAISPFTGLCGFRPAEEIRKRLDVFLEPSPPSAAPPPVLREGFAPLTRALLNHEPLRDFLAGLFGLSQQVREALTEYVLSVDKPPPDCATSHIGAPPLCDARQLMHDLARLYPGDPAVIAPLYLNVFRLEPGEAVFLEAGVLHAYIQGFGVELMANSDNVLRGGLTPKHVDVPELMKILDFKPFNPRVIAPNADFFNYPAPCGEFSLARIRGNPGVAAAWPLALEGPAICVVTEGELVISAANCKAVVKQGESLFIPPVKKGESPLSLSGNFTLYIASCGSP